jgi:Domain of unknown function (DUF4342)
MARTLWETIEGNAGQILAQLRRIVDEGNARRVVVRQHGKTIAEFPLTAGVIGAVIAPVAAAIGALSALIGDCTIEVERSVADDVAAADPVAGPEVRL